ncbi:MAG TPA: DNA repair protein RadC [Candidatus Paceibacterota bacterium]|jgi:DNA repair protein RadC|nr:DNA repair protein RadC [Candidatus Paceibacterota bacterium]
MQKSSYIIPDTTMILDRSPYGGEYPLLLRDLPPEGKPREKLLAQGPEALSSRELLAIVLHVGTVKEDVLEMSERLIRGYGENSVLTERDAQKLADEANIPIGKAMQIVALGELGRRTYDKKESGFKTIRNARDVYEYLADMRGLPKEYLRALFLNTHNRVIRDEVISIGTVNSNIVHPREVFRSGIESNAVAVIIAHNHPSGEAIPSHEDEEITKQLIHAGKILGIRVLDHVIITRDGFASVKAEY